MTKKTESYIRILCDLYQEIYGPKITIANLDELAGDLSQIAGRSRPWTGKFLHSLLKEYPGFNPNRQLIEALDVLASRLDGFDEAQARSKEVTVFATNDLPAGTIVLGQALRCARPGCQVRFVPTHPRQKYHNRACALLNRRRKRPT